MSDTIIAASLTLDANQATQSVGTFRTQLRNASQDLAVMQGEFGATSDQAVAAAKKVADIRDRIKEAKEVSDLFNPAMKFEALTKGAQTAAGGVTALTGAMALFGGQSDDVAKTLLKVQGALALSQGLSALGEVGRTFTLIKIAATEAFTAIKAGIGSTGIGLLVIALGAIVAYWDDIKVAIGGATGEQVKNLEEATKVLDIEKQKLEIITSQQDIYKQQGYSQQQILDIENKQLQTAILAAQKALDAQKVMSQQAINAANNTKLTGATSNPLGLINSLLYGDPEKVKIAQDKTILAAQATLDKLKDQLASNQLTIIASTVAFHQKMIDLEHAASEASITDQYVLSQLKLKDTYEAAVTQTKVEYTNLDQRNQALKALQAKYDAESAALAKANTKKKNDDLRKLNFDAYTASITDQNVLAQLQLKYQLQVDLEAANHDIANVKDRNEKIAAIQQVYDNRLAEMRLKNLQDFQNKYSDSVIAQQVAIDKKQEEDVTKEANLRNADDNKRKEQAKQFLILQKDIGDAHLDQAGQQAAQELKQLEDWYQKKIELAGTSEEAIAAINKEYERQKTVITEAENMQRLAIVSSVLGQAASLFSQASVTGKALAIAQTTIDTYQSAVSSYKSLAGIPVVGPALGFAAAAVAIAAGLANVKKIVSVQIPGASSGGSIPNIGGTSAPLQVTPQVGNTQLPQQQINQIGNSADPVRAFVVESDVSDNQERIKRLNRAARLGG